MRFKARVPLSFSQSYRSTLTSYIKAASRIKLAYPSSVLNYNVNVFYLLSASPLQHHNFSNISLRTTAPAANMTSATALVFGTSDLPSADNTAANRDHMEGSNRSHLTAPTPHVAPPLQDWQSHPTPIRYLVTAPIAILDATPKHVILSQEIAYIVSAAAILYIMLNPSEVDTIACTVFSNWA